MRPFQTVVARTFQEFLDLGASIAARQVSVAPCEEMAVELPEEDTFTSGRAGYTRLGVRYEARGTWLRRVRFFEQGMERLLTERARAQSALHEADTLICFATAAARVDTLTKAHPNLKFRLCEEKGPVSAKLRERVLSEVAERHLGPFVVQADQHENARE